MNVLIIEDEILAAGKLKSMLAEIAPDVNVLATLGSIKESIKWLLHNNADLIFLDIQLSDGQSFSIFEQVVVTTPVIFTTAYDHFAIKAFQLNSVSYLLKPIRKTDLEESLKKFASLRKAYNIDFTAMLSQLNGKFTEYKKRFLIQIGDKIRKVETDDIAYFYAYDKGCYLCTFNGHNYPVDYTLDKLEAELNPANYFRINRKYIVNINSITHMTAYSRGRIKLELKPLTNDEFGTIVSIDRSADFKKWLNS